MKFHKVDLIYFNILAYAEPIKMLLTHGGIEFNFWMPWDYFKKKWIEAKTDVPFGKLPILIINDQHVLWESGAIMQFLAKHTNTMPSDDFSRAEAHEFSMQQKIWFSIDATVNVRRGEVFEAERSSLLENLDQLLGPFATTLEENGPFLLGSMPYYCDFALFHHLSTLSFLTVEFLEQYPSLNHFMQEFEKIDGIKEYLNSRPQLTGIGVEPLLELNGVPTSTMFGRD